jgi:hypothetical protein
VFRCEDFVNFHAAAAGVDLEDFDGADLEGFGCGSVGVGADEDSRAVGGTGRAKTPCKIHRRPGDAVAAEATASKNARNDFTGIQSHADVEAALPFGVAFLVEVVNAGGEVDGGAAGAGGVALVGDGCSENDADAFAVAFIEVAAGFDEVVGGGFEIKIRDRRVVLGR